MRLTQGTFSFLPDFTDEQIEAQIAYSLDHGWAMSVEHTDDPHPRNSYWEMWGLPLFDLPAEDLDQFMREVRAARPSLTTTSRCWRTTRSVDVRRRRSASSSTVPPRSQASASIARTRTTA
jgi:hypothetical protein